MDVIRCGVLLLLSIFYFALEQHLIMYRTAIVDFDLKKNSGDEPIMHNSHWRQLFLVAGRNAYAFTWDIFYAIIQQKIGFRKKYCPVN